jgi:cytochrome c oxidase subunit 1
MRVFSLDHKVIGVQYAITSMVFLLIGFSLILLVRWQLAYPGAAMPVMGGLLGGEIAPAGIMTPELYNQLGAMHGTIMVFLAVVPLSVGGFGNYLVPLMIGAPEMALPKLNMLSFWTYAAAGFIMLASFALPGGAAGSGWTSYPPLSVLAIGGGQSWWLAGMVLLATSALLGSINTIVTIVQHRAPGLPFMRLPFFIWAQLVTAFLLLLAFPPLEVAALMQLSDRVAGSSFFMPSGLVVSGQAAAYGGGGNPLLWQHLFWFLAHPEVYVLILPAMGIVAEVIAVNTRKPLWGYRTMVWAAIFLGFVSMLVWAHHMFLTGMGTTMSAFFQTTTMVVSIPSVVILSALFLSLYGGSIRFPTPALFALAFLPMFGLGGLTGLPLGLAAADIHLHDTYYVIGHFHYIVAPGTIFALFAGVYHWFPRVTGRLLNERLGRVHFWGSLVCMNLVFFPMFIQGLAGVNRRLYDGGLTYSHGQALQHWNLVQGWAAAVLGLFQIVFLVNVVLSLRQRPAAANPWGAATMEWSPSAAHAVDSYTPRRDTGVTSISLGVWLLIASEAMLFGGLFSGYVLLRSGGADWPSGALPRVPALINTALMIGGSVAFAAAARLSASGQLRRARALLLVVAGLGAAFLAIKGFEYASEMSLGHHADTHPFWAMYYLLTGVHAVHLVAGIAIAIYLAGPGAALWERSAQHFAARVAGAARYWHFVDLIWLCIVGAVYWG